MISHTHTPGTHTHACQTLTHAGILCACINIQKDFACGAHFEYIWQFLQRSHSSSSSSSPSSFFYFFCLIVREMRNICIYLSSRKTAECRNVISMKAEQSTARQQPPKSSPTLLLPGTHPKVAASAQAHGQAELRCSSTSSLLFFHWIPCKCIEGGAA